MSFMNKVGNMFNKKTITKKGDANKYKPAGIHVLGEDYFSPNILSDDLIIPNYFQENDKQPPVVLSGSSNILPYITQHKNLNQMDDAKPELIKSEKKEESDIYKGFILMNGEKKFRTDNCYIKIDDNIFSCKVILTPFRVFIIPDFKKKNPNDFSYINYFPDNFFSLFIHKIDKVMKTSNDKSFDFMIDIIMKDQRTFSLIFKNNSGGNFLDQLNGIFALRERSHINVAFEYRKNNPIYKKENFEEGWNLYNPEKEYARQGITNLDYEVIKNKLFRKTKLNENYSLCPTYPKFLITVGEITDSDYKCSAEFRTKSRLPALAYYYPPSRGNIWRSAQTKSGIAGNRNRYDEDLLLYISQISKMKKLYIYDCRPYLSAVANKLKGAGHENVENYRGSEIFFCEIDNIHSARNALNKIYSMLKSNRFIENKNFFSSFESSGWPSFIFGIILASVNIASAVRKGYSVLIHCSDGWDRCSQLTAFSQLLIDPYFRTIKGYMTLIEKDFLSFGHQFRVRNGYYSKEEMNENKTSPILLQFLDATHQLLIQYPMYFEFNMKFLLFIANSINTGLYGTFLYDCEKDREKQNAKTKTMSCWTEILNNINIYKNQFYEEKSRKIYFLIPNFAMCRIRLWEEYFFPFTQINLNISYDTFINRFQESFYFNIFGQMKQKSRIISNVQYMIKEKENQEKEKDTLIQEIKKLKNAIVDLTIKNNLNKEQFEGLSNDSKNAINDIAKEEGGEMNLNEELNIFYFKEIPKSKEIKKDEIKKNEEIVEIISEKNEEKKEEKEIVINNEKKKEEPIKGELERKNAQKKEENKSENSINQKQINSFFGINQKQENKKLENNIINTEEKNLNIIQNIEEEHKINDEKKLRDRQEGKEEKDKNIIKEGNLQANNKENLKLENIKENKENEQIVIKEDGQIKEKNGLKIINDLHINTKEDINKDIEINDEKKNTNNENEKNNLTKEVQINEDKKLERKMNDKEDEFKTEKLEIKEKEKTDDN